MKTDEVCGRPRHPFGFATTPNLVCIVAWGKTKGTQTNWSNDKDQLCKRAPKVSKGRSESPLVASAEAKSLRMRKPCNLTEKLQSALQAL